MNHSESITKITEALLVIQAALPEVKKDSENSYFKKPDKTAHKYASLEVVLDTVKPFLIEQEILLVQGGTESPAGTVSIETRLIHKSGEWVSTVTQLPYKDSDPQKAGSAITYAKRYGLLAILSLPTVDDDANEAAQPVTKPQPKENEFPSEEQRYENFCTAMESLAQDHGMTLGDALDLVHVPDLASVPSENRQSVFSELKAILEEAKAA